MVYTNNMFVVKYRKIWFIVSLALILTALYGMFTFGFNTGVDFRGGTITEVRFDEGRPEKTSVEEWIRSLNLGGFSVRPSGEESYIIRTQELSDEERENLVSALNQAESEFTIERSNTIGPVAGETLRTKALQAVAVVVLMIVLFVSFAFRKVSKPIASWKYGLVTIISLAHDVIIPTGAFVFLGYFMGLEIDLLFVSGILAILGYSVHDTIVVFDRVRENLRVNEEHKRGEPFEQVVGRSVNETLARSINTSLTTFILLLTLYFVGSGATKDFALLLGIGIIVGAYSSIFVASPLLVTLYKLQKK